MWNLQRNLRHGSTLLRVYNLCGNIQYKCPSEIIGVDNKFQRNETIMGLNVKENLLKTYTYPHGIHRR